MGLGLGSPSEKLNVDGNILATGTVLGSNLSGTNTGDQDLSGYSLTTDLDDYLPLSAGSTKPLTGDLYIDSIIRNNSGDLEIRNQTASGFATATKLKQQTANGLETFLTFDGTSRNAYFTNQGNVGIGTTSPGAKLQVYSTATRDISIFGHGTQAQNNWQAEHAFFTSAGQGVIVGKSNAENNTNRLHILYNTSNGDAEYLGYDTSSTNKVRLNTNGDSFLNGGNVGIGTSSPGYKLHVEGSVALDVMPGHESEGSVRIGRYDTNTSRYNDIKSYVSSTESSNYLKFSVHTGVENATVDVMTLKGNSTGIPLERMRMTLRQRRYWY